MTTIKSFTDIPQSKKLAEILPLESADMGWYYSNNPNAARNQMWTGTKAENADIPCWSLSALLSVLPEINDIPLTLEKVKAEDGYEGYYYHIEYKDKILIPYNENPIDACYGLILKLHELNLL